MVRVCLTDGIGSGWLRGVRYSSFRRLPLGQFISPPDTQQKLFERRISGIKGFAPAGIGFTVKVAVISLIDARHLFTRLADEGGKPLAVR